MPLEPVPPELILQIPFPVPTSPLQPVVGSMLSVKIRPELPAAQVKPAGACGGYRQGEQLPQHTVDIVISDVPTDSILFV